MYYDNIKLQKYKKISVIILYEILALFFIIQTYHKITN